MRRGKFFFFSKRVDCFFTLWYNYGKNCLFRRSKDNKRRRGAEERNTNMAFLYFLEGLRKPVLDFIFSLITRCGEETVFMAVGMIVFWCFSKNEGYYLLCVGFLGTVINQFLKMVKLLI